jgi:hypothetical protein
MDAGRSRLSRGGDVDPVTIEADRRPGGERLRRRRNVQYGPISALHRGTRIPTSMPAYGAQPQLRRAASSTASSQLGRWNNVWRAIRGFPLWRHASCAKGVYPLSQFLWYTRYQ